MRYLGNTVSPVLKSNENFKSGESSGGREKPSSSNDTQHDPSIPIISSIPAIPSIHTEASNLT